MMIIKEAEKVRKEEEARLRSRLGAHEAAIQAEKAAQVRLKNYNSYLVLN